MCPAPTKDVPHGDRGQDYEDVVHLRVNPIAPLPRGYGVSLIDPPDGKIVYLDDCFRYAGDLVDGDMRAGDLVEAKGHVEFLLRGMVPNTEMEDEVTQARKELRVADVRGVGLKWYFAESGAAEIMRQRFGRERDLKRIVVGYLPSKVTLDSGFCADVAWSPRDQAPPDLAVRYIELITRLRAIDPIFDRWLLNHKRMGVVPLKLDPAAVTDAIAAGVGRDDEGKPEPLYGYGLEAMNGWEGRPGPRDFHLIFHADANWKHAQNSASLATLYGVDPDPAAITFDIMKGVVVSLGESFDGHSAQAWPTALTELRSKGDEWTRLPIAWISYLGPAYAHLVTPPPTAIVEHRPDGGLLMAATDETFAVDNPTHMAAARDIAAAAAPFNALPRPLGGGRFDERCLPIRD